MKLFFANLICCVLVAQYIVKAEETFFDVPKEDHSKEKHDGMVELDAMVKQESLNDLDTVGQEDDKELEQDEDIPDPDSMEEKKPSNDVDKRGHNRGFTTRRPFRFTTRRPFRFTTRRPFRFTTRRPFRFTTRRPFQFTTRRPFRFTTRRPFRFTTRAPFFGGIRCVICSASRSERECLSKNVVRSCRRGYSCFTGEGTLRNNGQSGVMKGCFPSSRCTSLCFILRRQVRNCRVRCCNTNLCNTGGVNPTGGPRNILSILLKMVQGFAAILDAIAKGIKAGVSSGGARIYKRQITTMMDQVESHADLIKESSDPQAVSIRADVDQIRERAKLLIKQLDELPEKKDK